MCLDELSLVVRRSRRIFKDISSRREMRLLPVFILETQDQTKNKYLPKFIQTEDELSFWTDNVSSSIKTAIVIRPSEELATNRTFKVISNTSVDTLGFRPKYSCKSDSVKVRGSQNFQAFSAFFWGG